MKLLIISGFILAYYFIVNIVRLLKCKHFLKIYHKNENGWNFTRKQDEIIGLFKKAGIGDSSVPYVEPVGYCHVSKGMASVFQNLSYRDKNIVNVVLVMFHRSIGIYSKRCRNSFNPLFWVEGILNLPKNTLKYLGLPAEHIVIKISQVFYWSFSGIISFFVIFFKPEMAIFVKKLFSSLF